MLPRLRDNVQRLIDEYVGAVGSTAILSRRGEVLFRSTHDDSAAALAPIVRYVSRAQLESLDAAVVALPVDEQSCGYGVAIDANHVLLVVTELGIGPSVAAERMKKAAALLGRVLVSWGGAIPGGGAPSGGASGAPAELFVKALDRRSH
jgi:hypothetical protein